MLMGLSAFANDGSDDHGITSDMTFEAIQGKMKIHISGMQENLSKFEICVTDSKSKEDLQDCKAELESMKEDLNERMQSISGCKED